MTKPLDLTGIAKIVVLTGAGVSVSSGLRPYRGPGGLWEEHPELAATATGEAAKADPMAPWRAFGPLRKGHAPHNQTPRTSRWRVWKRSYAARRP